MLLNSKKAGFITYTSQDISIFLFVFFDGESGVLTYFMFSYIPDPCYKPIIKLSMNCISSVRGRGGLILNLCNASRSLSH